MSRRNSRYDDSELDASRGRQRKRRFSKRSLLLTALILTVLGCFFLIPTLVQNRSIFVSVVNRFAGIAPLRIDVQQIQAGWFSPIQLSGIRVVDERSSKLVEIGKIETELTLVGLISNSKNLRTILIKDFVLQFDVQPGTTSLEESLKPMMTSSAPASGASSTSSMPTGRIQIENALIVARDSVDLSSWELAISKADIPIPRSTSEIPAIAIEGLVRSGLKNGGTAPGALTAQRIGQFSVRVEPPTTSEANQVAPVHLFATIQNMPMECWSLAKRRMPSLPIDRLAGQASLVADILMIDPNNVSVQINSAQLDQVVMMAPTLVGDQIASIQKIQLATKLNYTPTRIQAQGMNLQCDFGSIAGSASIPLPVPIPSATKPWMDDSELDLQGKLDLAGLAKVAPGLIKMQDQTQLVAGMATIRASQRLENDKFPLGQFSVDLGDLVANVQGNTMRWDRALTSKIDIQKGEGGQPKFNMNCNSEFFKLVGQGDLRGGQIKVRVELDPLQQRLSQWFSLSVQQLSGTSDCDLQWNQIDAGRIRAVAKLTTTPIRIQTNNGMMNEPAWNGSLDVLGRMDQSVFRQIDRASLQLTSNSESLKVEILEPMIVASDVPGIQPLPPASMNVAIVGDVAGWQQRARLLAGIDLGFEFAGSLEAKMQGHADMKHVEVTKADWTMDQFLARGQGLAMLEPRMVGAFAGRIDSQDISRLQVDSLTVQAAAFAISARDSAASNGRQGQAAFRVDPNLMLKAMDSGTSSSASTIPKVEGDVTGTATWTIDANALAWQSKVDGKNIRVHSMDPVATGTLVSTSPVPSNSVLWEEPLAQIAMVGRYDLKTGALQMPETSIKTDWLLYSGTAAMESIDQATSKLAAKGQLTYDAGTVARRMKAYLGDYLNIVGQRTEPFELTWVSSSNSNWASALQAKTRLGWEQANLVGIDLGKADVPLVIENGRFQSKTEIPVNQGALRWNLDADMAGDPIVIRQSPEKVLDNVAITPMMCRGWLKYIAPLVADVTKVEGRLSLQLKEASFVPTDLRKQTVVGQLQMHGATVGPGPLADQLLGLVQQVRALRKGAASTTSAPNATWLQLPEQSIDFAVEQGRVLHRNMQIAAGDVTIITSGEVAIDGGIQMQLQVPIRADWVEGTPALASLVGQSITLPVTGTLQKPQIDMRGFGQITLQLAQSAALNAGQGMIQKQLDRGLNKVLGPMQQQFQNFQGVFPQGLLPQAPAATPPTPVAPQ